MHDHVVFVTTELQEQRISRLEAALKRQNKNLRKLKTACLLLVTMGLLIELQVENLKNNVNKKE